MAILVVEDDPVIANALQLVLRSDGHAVDCASNGDEADRFLCTSRFDMVLLDLGLPVLDGLEVLRRLRSRRALTPVLILSARDAGEDRVRGLDLGADDYLAKPFGIDELRARVRALLRRAAAVDSSVIVRRRLRFNTTSRTAWIGDAILNLTSREVSLLETLMLSYGNVVDKERLLNRIFGPGGDVGLNCVEVYVYRLRRKLAGSEVALRTSHGRGYLLCDEMPACDKLFSHILKG